MGFGIYAAAAGMAAQQAWLDSLAGDIANVNTQGYRQSRTGFKELVDGAGSAAVEAGRSLRPGSLVETGDPFALAIAGPGFFTVKRADGQSALTRGGLFRVDANGAVVTAGGSPLVPPITLPKDASLADVMIDPDGTVRIGDKSAGKITLVDVPVPESLQAAGDGLWTATTASGAPAELKDGVVKQGFVEGSNVDMAGVMTDLVQAQRGYELQSRVLRMQDELMEIANGIRR